MSDLEALRAEAAAILKKDNTNFAMRSCWNCNSGHEYLKEADYIIWCFSCGHWFYKGMDITVEDEDEPSNPA